MNVLDQDQHSSILVRIVHWWKERAAQRQAMEELRAMGDAALNELARDFGVSSDQLLSLVARGRHSADEMVAMMREIGLDPEVIEQAKAQIFRDMQLVCAFCESKGQCHHDFAAHTAEEHFEVYCPNARQLKELKAEQQLAKVA
jgi:hypothetical protein